MKKVLIGFAVLAVVAAVAFFYWNSKRIESYVLISINPEVELALSGNDTVIDVEGLNADADVLLSDLDLEGKSVEEATDIIIDEATEAGYLDEYSDENDIIITTVNEDEDERGDLEEKVYTELNNQLKNNGVSAVVVVTGVTDEMKSDADVYGISYGKMLLVEKALILDATLVKDDLATLSVKDIQSIIKENSKERRENIGKTREEQTQIKEQLKTQTEDGTEIYEESLLEDEGIDPSTMTEEQKEEALNTLTEEKKLEIKNKADEVQNQVNQTIKNQKPADIKKSIETVRKQVKSKNK